MLPSIKRIFPPDFFLFFVTGILIIFLNTGCNTRIQGCLEVNAENFDLEAERPCKGCCTYPSMRLTMSQKWGDENFANTDTLFDMQGQPYQITDLKYFLTSWTWKDPSGEIYTVDSVTAACHSATLTYTPDVLVVDTRKFSYTLGTIRQAPLLESVQFSLGLVGDFSCLGEDNPDIPVDLTDQSPLWNPQTSSLETVRLIVRRSLSSDLVDTIFINTQMEYFIPYNEQIDLGFDFELGLTVNYGQWFQDVDINELSSFRSSILTQLDGSFSRTP